MKTFKYFFSALVAEFTFSCNTNEPPYPSNPLVESTYIQNTDTVDRTFTEDVDRLRYKINERIKEIDADIQKSMNERKAERNAKKQKNYDEWIAKRETRKKEFNDKLDELGRQTKQGWNKFKADVEDFFDRDRKDTIPDRVL